VCVDPPSEMWDRYRGRHHPQSYALQAQGHVRDLRPPVDDPDAILVGEDEHGIAAVVAFGWEPREQHYMIQVVARALRRAGDRCGAEALQWALTVLAAERLFDDGDESDVYARIDPENEPSKRLFSSMDFEHIEDDGDMELWARLV